MGSGLDYLLSEGIITEVLARLQSGKEAEVFVVRYGGKVVAAKVYKDRAHRSFKNNSAYKEGRSVRNSRSQRAIDKGSKFGKDASEEAWKTAEVDALYRLHAANVRVPTPVMFIEGVLLMELVLDADGEAAPRVIDADITPEQANQAYYDMLGQLVRMLSCELIHGDLSPYNVLWGVQGPTIIDFPQIVSAAHNSTAERFFLRDAENILAHFARIDRSLDGRSSDAWEIWKAYVSRELSPDFRPTGRMNRPPPRVFAPPPQRFQAPAPVPPQAQRPPAPKVAPTPYIGKPVDRPLYMGRQRIGGPPQDNRPRMDGPPPRRPPHVDPPPQPNRAPRMDTPPQPRAQHAEARPQEHRAPRHDGPPQEHRAPRHDGPPQEHRAPRHDGPPQERRAPRHDGPPPQEQRPPRHAGPPQEPRPLRHNDPSRDPRQQRHDGPPPDARPYRQDAPPPEHRPQRHDGPPPNRAPRGNDAGFQRHEPRAGGHAQPNDRRGPPGPRRQDGGGQPMQRPSAPPPKHASPRPFEGARPPARGPEVIVRRPRTPSMEPPPMSSAPQRDDHRDAGPRDDRGPDSRRQRR